MAKNAIGDWSTTASDNTDIGGIGLGEGVMTADKVNDALREMMAQGAANVASETVAGRIELATQAEVNTGTDTARAVTPATLKVRHDEAAPSGAVCMFARNSAPDGWLKANGATVSRTTYAALFAAIGTTFGAGDGSTTFTLPDLRGEFLRAWDDSRGVDSGRAFGSAQLGQNASHNHNVSYAGFTATGLTGSAGSGFGAFPFGGTGPTTTNTAGNRSASNDGLGSIWPQGGAEARPRSIALLACIKY